MTPVILWFALSRLLQIPVLNGKEVFMHSKIPLDKLIEKFLKSKQCFSLVPLGSSVTLPFLIKISDKVYLSFLFYTGKKLESESRIKIYRPHTKIYLDYSTARLVCYFSLSMLNNSNSDKWKEPIGKFPHKEIETLTFNEYKKRKSELIADYDKAIETFIGNSSDSNFRNEFSKRFYQLCEPPLLPYMREASPKFFEWLDRI